MAQIAWPGAPARKPWRRAASMRGSPPQAATGRQGLSVALFVTDEVGEQGVQKAAIAAPARQHCTSLPMQIHLS